MCTFADAQIPIATEALKPFLTFERFFTFNNSDIYTPSWKGTDQTKFLWKMTM
jgi:hypothetical protein